MKFVIYGAGAMGGSLGAYMVNAGEDVLFVDINEDHVKTMNEKGLRVDGYGGEVTVPVKAVTPNALNKPLEVVVLSVKSQHTAQAVRQFMGLLDERSVVVSLQNGLNEHIIAQLIGVERTVGAFVNWAADYIGPGHIKLGGKGSFYLGELSGRVSERVKALEQPFSALFPVLLTDNILGYLWSKQVDASLLFATALADLPINEVVEIPGMDKVMGNLVCEAMQVPAAMEIRLERFDEFDPDLYTSHRFGEAMAKVAAQYRHNIKNKTGVWRDLAVRKRKTEVDGIIGETVRQGESRGLLLPLNKRLIELIHEVEDGMRAMDVSNFKEIGLK